MARLSLEDQAAKREKFKNALLMPEFHGLNRGQKALLVGISLPTLDAWMDAVTVDEWIEVKKTLDRMNVKEEIEIDFNFTKRAKSGDPSSVELWKKLFRGWSPKQTNENINKNADLADEDVKKVQREAALGLSREELLRLADEKGKPPTEVVDGTNG